MVEGLDWSDPIIGFDLQTTVIAYGIVRGKRYETDHLKLAGTLPEKLHTFRRWLRWYIGQVRPAVIACEAPIVYQGRANAAIPLLHFHGVFKEALAKVICPTVYIEEAKWKAQVLGSGRITSKQKKDGAVMLGLNKLQFDVRHLDEADALAVALCCRKGLFGRIQ